MKYIVKRKLAGDYELKEWKKKADVKNNDLLNSQDTKNRLRGIKYEKKL